MAGTPPTSVGPSAHAPPPAPAPSTATAASASPSAPPLAPSSSAAPQRNAPIKSSTPSAAPAPSGVTPTKAATPSTPGDAAANNILAVFPNAELDAPSASILTASKGKKRGSPAAAGATQAKRKAPRVPAKGEPDVPVEAKDAVKSLPNAPVLPATPVILSSQYSRLDASDTAEARALGLLNATIEVSEDTSSSEYGVAYEKRGGSKAAGCGTDVFPTQKALQERCKQFAMERGFQLYVSGSSSRADGGGNVKYRCKKLHGQQFFDPNTPVEQLQCPFYINGFGLGPAWKITRACFLHNHYKFIGSRLNMNTGSGAGSASSNANVDDVTIPMGGDAGAVDKASKPRPQRNTTLSTNVLCRMVNEELDKYPSSAIAMSKLDGKLIKRILLSRGHTINHMMASRIKRQIQMNRIQSIRSSFQRLRSYFDLIVEKNTNTKYVFEMDDRNTFERAMVMPAPTMHAMQYCQKVLSFDSIRASAWGDAESKPSTAEGLEEESDDAVSGVYLYASTKDHSDKVVVIAVALVTVENFENWTWFLSSLQNSQNASLNVGWNEYTIFSGRTNGLQQAVHTVWPHASHHLCVRRLVEEELVLHKKLPLPEDKKQRIYDLARCESEADYKHIRQELALTNEAVVNFLDSLNRASWVKYAFLEAFKKPTYGVISSDLSSPEDNKQPVTSVNAKAPSGGVSFTPSVMPLLKQWFGDELPRSSQPLLVFNRYFMKIAENFHARRKMVEHRPLPELVPSRFNQLEQILQGSQRCESVPCSNGTFMVRSLAQLNTTTHDTWRHVNLLDWECTCLDWQDRLFPCVHGIHAAELNRRRIDSLYNAKVYSVEHYKTCYEVGFTPWPLESATLQVDETLTIALEELYVQDPNVKRKPGPRPKKKLGLSKVV